MDALARALRIVGISLLSLGSTAGTAHAEPVRTCVTVDATGVPGGDSAEEESLLRLVRAELESHPTHLWAAEGCSSFLSVELFRLRGKEYLTFRINWQVPHRAKVEEGDLAGTVEQALRVVLHNDPVRLRAPGERGALAALSNLKEHGVTLYGLEAFQLVGLIDGQPYTLPGLAFRARRELSRWHLGTRVSVAVRTARVPSRLSLVLVSSLSFELCYFLSEHADTAPYVGAALGLEHHWFTGPLEDDPNRADDANRTGLALGPRFGVEVFRTSRTRIDFFGQVSLPLFLSRDENDQVIRHWFPTLSAGVGITL